jgi:hypothetical protein
MDKVKGGYLRRDPRARPLVEAGLWPTAALRLVRAGYTSLEKLAAATRDDLLAIRGVNLKTVEACERLLGHPLPWPTAYWTGRGLLPYIARTLCRAGIDSLEALGKLSFKDMRALGIGVSHIRKCEELLGRPFDDG